MEIDHENDRCGEDARRRFEEKHQLNSNIKLVEELNRIKGEIQKKRDEENAPDENVNLFDSKFSEKIRNIKLSISQITIQDTVIKCEDLKNKVAEISDFLNSSVHFLNSYTILSCQQKITQLLEEINNVQASFAPRKKFAFSKRAAKKEEIQVESNIVSKEITITIEGIQDQNNVTITKQDLELKDLNCYQLKNISNSRIYLLGRLKAIHILNLVNCEIYIGPVAGAAHITECTNCIIYVAAHQIRIHKSANTDFYIFVATNPIVENVKNVRFAPYTMSYKGIDEHLNYCALEGENKWDQVQDFKWLKQEKSPHWDILEENLRINKFIE